MKARTRLFVKIIFISFFAVLAPLVILYTMGYRYNFSAKQIQKTGVIVVSTYPDDARVYLNGRLVDEQTPSIIKKILPNEYTVEIIKEGYLPWSKKLEVKSGETTFAESVHLFLDEEPRPLFDRQIIMTGFSPDRTKLLYVTEEASWAEIWLYSPKKKEFTLIDRRDTNNFVDASFKWSPGSEKIFLTIIGPEKNEQLIYDVRNEKSVSLEKYFDQEINKFKWSRTSDDIFYFVQDKKLYSVNLLTEQKTFLLNAVDEYFVRGNTIYLISANENSRRVESYNIIDPAAEITLLYELPPANYIFEDASFPYLLIRNTQKGELLLYDTSAPFLEPILQVPANRYHWYTSGQGEKRLLYTTEFEIWIFYPQNKYNELITRHSSIISDALWHQNGGYVFYNAGNAIKAIELDAREKRNVFDLATNEQITDFTVDHSSENLYYVGSAEDGRGLYHLPLVEE